MRAPMSGRCWPDWRRYGTSADHLLGLSDDPRLQAGAARLPLPAGRHCRDSLERLADRADEFVDELIEFRFAPEPDIDALTAFVRF